MLDRNAWLFSRMAFAWGSTFVMTTALCAVSSHDVRAADPVTREVNGLALRVDADLDIEPVAGADLIKWPIVADWDGQGRLVVAECGGVSKPIVEHNKQLLHRIVRLVDSNGDGKFDKRVVAADKLAFPEGVLCVGNSILVSTPPQIWKLTDENNDGVCEKREIWYDPGTITGCANDLHGPYMGRDGWIYWCKGAFAEQTHKLISGGELVTRASHIFRRKLEGGAVEAVMTGGMDNPVEMAISHAGERFFTSTFLQHPGDGKRDGIAHALYGGVYGKSHDVLNGHKRTGELMPIMTHLGPAAPSGLICLESNRLLSYSEPVVGSAAIDKATAVGVDTLVAAQFNLHKVTAHRLIPNGAGFVTENRELVGSERIDFHPTDVIEASDGSLLVIDTGGWYNLCCPSSHIDQSIATGGIYRLTSRTTRQVRSTPPIAWDELTLEDTVKILDDATQTLLSKQQAAWRLCRINTSAAHDKLIATLSHSEPELRQLSAHALSVQRVSKAAKPLEQALAKEQNSAAARAMAEALGRLGSEQSVSIVLSKLPLAKEDRMLEHSLLYALIELNRPEQLVASLKSSNSNARRASMLVLDQLGRSELLSVKEVMLGLASDDAQLRQCSSEILVRHADWAAASAAELELVWDRVLKDTKHGELVSGLSSVLAAWVSTPQVVDLIAKRIDAASVVADSVSASQAAGKLVSVLSSVRNQKLPSSWTGGLVKLLNRSDEPTRAALVAWLSNMKIEASDASTVNGALLSLARNAKEEATKLRLVGCLRAGTRLEDEALETFVVEAFVGKAGVQYVSDATAALSRLQLSQTTAQSLIANLGDVQPLQLLQAVTSVSSIGNDALDTQLLDKLATLPAARTLPLDQLTSVYRSRSEAVRGKVKNVVETLGKPPADVEAKLDSLLAQLKSGDANKGFQVFRSAKAACSACHRIGYVGGTVGPELTRIGTTRTRRALLEAIVFPNARLEQSYTPLRVLTVDGQVYNGIVARETGSELELITGANQRVTIPTADIEQRSPSPVSIMPAGLEQQLSLDELADLLTLLESAGKR